jgi:hypothetical protein
MPTNISQRRKRWNLLRAALYGFLIGKGDNTLDFDH